jgi:hypothetical protein
MAHSSDELANITFESKIEGNTSFSVDTAIRLSTAICKLETRNSKHEVGTGFLCRVPVGEYTVYGIMTSKHVVQHLQDNCHLQNYIAHFEQVKPSVSVRLSQIISNIMETHTHLDALFLVCSKSWISSNANITALDIEYEKPLQYLKGMEFYSLHYMNGTTLTCGSGEKTTT